MMKRLILIGALLVALAAAAYNPADAQITRKPFYYEKSISNTAFIAESIYVHGNYTDVIHPTFINRDAVDSIYVSAEKDTASAYIVAKIGPNESYTPQAGCHARYFHAKATGTALLIIKIGIRGN